MYKIVNYIQSLKRQAITGNQPISSSKRMNKEFKAINGHFIYRLKV